MSKPTRYYGRTFYFGRGRKEELRKRGLEWQALGNIDPEWDGLADAEDEIARPATDINFTWSHRDKG